MATCYSPRQYLSYSKWLSSAISLLIMGYCCKVQAYEQYCTHPTLTRRAAELYARYSGQEFNSTIIQKLEQGSTHEDNGSILYFRSTNHFYDIHKQRPWSSPFTAEVATVFSPCFPDAAAKGYIRTSKDWALNEKYQQLSWKINLVGSEIDCTYDGDYSWPTVLRMLDSGESLEKIAYAQGHLLHLMQDLTVPAHTRNDTHIANKDELEKYAKKDCYSGQSIIPAADKLLAEGVMPIVIDDFGRKFDELAEFTYSHFYSDDTIFSNEYDAPHVVRRGDESSNDGSEHTYLYGVDISSTDYKLTSEYRLLEVRPALEKWLPKESKLVYILNPECLADYWKRTLRKAIAYSAGALKKLSEEAAKRGKCFPSCPIMNPTPCSGKIDGLYCGNNLSGYTGNPNDLVNCRSNMVANASLCMYGCQINPPGTNDICKPGPCTTYYLDQDSDSHGDRSQPGKCMAGPSAPYTVTNNDDCNDADRDIYPGHIEWWDVKDNDCDGKIDEDGLNRYNRWHKEWTATDLEHRFAVSSPGAGFSNESPRSLQLYPPDVCTGSYKSPTCNLISGGAYAEVRSGMQLASLGECSGQFTMAPFAHVTLYVLEDSGEYRNYLTGVVPGFNCRRFGYVLWGSSIGTFSGRKAFNRLRSVFTTGGRYDNMWSTDTTEAGHTDYNTMYPEDRPHWYAPDGL